MTAVPRSHAALGAVRDIGAAALTSLVLVGCAAGASTRFTAPRGAYDPHATGAQVCSIGLTRSERVKDTYALRDLVYRAYGLPRGHRRGYVIDHMIPLELGGVTAGPNLWPQQRADAARKDGDEGRLHEAVCSGRMTLAEARAEALRLWRR